MTTRKKRAGPLRPRQRLSAKLAASERARAESEARYRELALNAERYRRFFSVASDWFWETDTKYRFVYISASIETITGLPVSHYLGKRLTETGSVTIPPEASEKAIAAHRVKGPYSDFRYMRKRADGKVIWISISATPRFAADGEFLGYCGISRDVTEQVAGEIALREAEQQARKLFEVAADYYWEMDEKYRYAYLSPSFGPLFGLPTEQMIGKRLTEDPNVSVEPEMGKMALSAQKAKQPFRDFVYSRKYPDGRTRWFKTSGTPYFDKDGAWKGYRGVGAEITAHVEAEAAASLAQRRLHDAVAHVSQPFVVYDADDRAVAYNQAFIDLHANPGGKTPVYQGVPFRELAEWQLETGFYANSPDDSALDLETLLDRCSAESEHSYRLRDDRWFIVTYRRVPGEGKVSLWNDITALKRAEAERRMLEAQLQHSQRLEALGTLAGGAAHEINNALVPVIALTKIVAGHLPEDSRDRRSLGTVLVGAERSRDLVKQILSFSRKEENAQRQENIDLAGVLRDALQLMRATVPTSIRLVEEITPAPPIIGDPNQLHQVIVNLVANAAHAIGEAHGTITVGLRTDGDVVRICVGDTGSGMDAATKARIFEPFFTTKQVGTGTGLGLAVVHGIVKQHGGRIDVESAPGRGTRFDIVIPLKAAEAGAAA
jgi:PAS domain S-box-containing protein